MSKPVKRVAAYIRVSTSDQADKFGKKAQLADIESKLKKLQIVNEKYEWKLLPIYEDDISGTKRPEAREGLARLFEDIEIGAVDCVIVSRLDRVARTMLILLEIVDFFTKHNVDFVSANESDIDTSQPAGRLQLHMFSVLAEYERDMILLRTFSGKAAKAKEGQWIGGSIPYGFVIEGKTLAHNPEQIEHVRNMFRWFAFNKLSKEEIAKRLTDNGVPRMLDEENREKGKRLDTLGIWSGAQVYNILNNSVYSGKKEVTLNAPSKRKEEQLKFTLSVPPIFDSNEQFIFELVRDQFDEWRGGNNSRKDHVRLINKKIRCSTCGRTFTSYIQKKKNKDGTFTETVQYRCVSQTKRNLESCGNKGFSQLDVLNFIWPEIRKVLEDPQYILEQQRDKLDLVEETKSMQADIEKLKKEISGLEKKVAEVMHNFTTNSSGIYASAEQFEHLVAMLNDQIREKKNTIKELQETLLRRQPTNDQLASIEFYTQKYLTHLDNLSLEEIRDILQKIVKRVYKYENNLFEIELNFTLEKPVLQSRHICSTTVPEEGDEKMQQEYCNGGQ